MLQKHDAGGKSEEQEGCSMVDEALNTPLSHTVPIPGIVTGCKRWPGRLMRHEWLLLMWLSRCRSGWQASRHGFVKRV